MSVPSSTFQTDNISNSTATEDSANRYNVCMRTGFRVKPGQLIEDAYGSLVRHESFDKRHPQEFIRPIAEELTGPLRPEASNDFILGGGDTVYQITQSSGPSACSLAKSASLSAGVQETISFWGKNANSGRTTYVGIERTEGVHSGNVIVNLTSGIIEQQYELGSNLSLDEISVNGYLDDWYFVSIKATGAASTGQYRIVLINRDNFDDTTKLSSITYEAPINYTSAYIQSFDVKQSGVSVLNAALPDFTASAMTVAVSTQDNYNVGTILASSL